MYVPSVAPFCLYLRGDGKGGGGRGLQCTSVAGMMSESTIMTSKGSRPEHCPVSFLRRSTVSLHGGVNSGGLALLL